MAITAQMVKELREMTGVGPMKCKQALEQFDGDLQKAAEYLREQGMATAAKKAGRAANEGIIQVYQHHDGRLAVLVEVNCETDFVAATEQFQNFAKDIALQVANLDPKYVSRDDVPQDILDAESERLRKQALEEGKPENIVDKMVEGRLNKFLAEIVLLEQAFIKDDEKNIEDLRKEIISELKENIVIRRFSRFAIGEIGDEETDED